MMGNICYCSKLATFKNDIFLKIPGKLYATITSQKIWYNYYAMEIKQQFKQKQRFSQQLQQSLAILGLQLLELRNLIETELANNPVLEEVPKKQEDVPIQTTQSSAEIEETELPYLEKKPPAEEIWTRGKSVPSKKETLFEFLFKQLNIAISDKQKLKIGISIINHLDENGYFKGSTEEIAQLVGCTSEEVEKLLEIIKTFEPQGVGAKNLKECLLIQLDKLKKPHPLAHQIIQDHLDDLAKKNYSNIIKKTKASQTEITEAVKQIIHLEPKPGRSFYSEEIPYIIPDATIEEKDNTFLITVRDEQLPHIFINPKYKKLLSDKNSDEETKNFIRQKLNNANNLIRSIKQRNTTIYKVVRLILDVQKQALTEGMDKLKPLTLKEIAKQIGLHETTISRVVMNKYIQTPYGMFALKEFFSGGLKSQEGQDISSQRIKLKIQELIDEENKQKPLSDMEIAEIIKSAEKINLARRTVAKYREQLKIPPKSKRRIK